jgi:LytS/YehU family sensor histidine kinase
MKRISLKQRFVLNATALIVGLGLAIIFTVLSNQRLQTIDSSILTEQNVVQHLYATLTATIEHLTAYLQTNNARLLNIYNSTYPRLEQIAVQFAAFEHDETGWRVSTDFKYMIQTFLEEANASVQAAKLSDIATSNEHLFAAEHIMKLINGQLPSVFAVVTTDSARLESRASRVRLSNLVVSIGLFFIALAVSVLFIYQVLRRIVIPIEVITQTARRIQQGEACLRVSAQAGDQEILVLTEAFNHMLETIEHQIEEARRAGLIEVELQHQVALNERMRALAREAELQAMQAQINPHFLFNSLSMIRDMAYIEDAEKTATLLEAMSAFLRYTMKNATSGKTTIDDEFDHLQNYVYVQHLRFGERIHFEITCDEAARPAVIPPLIIQPLVENAITHGVKSYVTDGRVFVRVAKINDFVEVNVIDNGLGMTAEVLGHVVNSLGAENSGNVGVALYNIYQRLMLFFGIDAKLQISSAKGKGTTVCLRFPYMELREGAHV